MLIKSKIQMIDYRWDDCIIAFLLFLASMFYRPMLLGNMYSTIGMVLFILAILLMLCRNHGKIKFSHNTHGWVYITAMFLFIYCLFQCIILRSDRQQAGIQTIIILIIAVSAYYIGFSNKAVEAIFIRIVFVALMFFSCSYVISLILMLMRGWNAIQITSIDYDYFVQSGVYFPFTTTYGSMNLNGLSLKRLLGFAKESGIMQIFYVWGFYSADKYYAKPRVVQVLMLIGVLACLSTTGFIVFAVSLLLYFDIRSIVKKGGIKKVGIIIMLMIAMVYVLFYAGGTKISDRAVATIDDRMEGITYGLSAFMQNPLFGGGFYSTLGNTDIQSGVCAVASLGQVGLIGILLWLMVFVCALYDCPNRKRFIYTNAALFITALFAQPIMFAPVMYWFLFCDYRGEMVALTKMRTSKFINRR